MWTFRVWAPDVKSVAVRCLGRDEPLREGADAWWAGTVADAVAGTDYQFVLDGGAALPDPRSPWQPDGVDGPSRIVDHSSFQWTDDGWQPGPLSAAIIYELHIGTFTPGGTFDSTIDRLDYLRQLGVTHIEFMPVNEFPGEWGWGYDGVDLYAPHHCYGGPEALKRLVDACHARGLAAILDVVYNHLGPSGNYLSQFGPYFTRKHTTPWGEAVNLDDAGSTEVRRFFCDNALMWLRDYHFDGLRLDAVHALIDSSAVHLLEQLATEVDALEASTGRHKFLIAESDLNEPRVVRPREAGGYGVAAQWSDDLHHTIHSVVTGETAGYYEDFGGMDQVGKAVQDVFVYDGTYSKHRGRVHGRPVGSLSRTHFLGYIQTHDQVGNRAQGERITSLTSLGRAKIAAAIYLTSPFIPMIFMGEEFGASTPFQYFTHHSEPELAKAVSEGRRKEFAKFGWRPEDVPDPQDPETFQRSKLKWDEIGEPPHRELLDWYQALIQLRRSTPSLAAGGPVGVSFGHDWLRIDRGEVVVCSNFSKQCVDFQLGTPSRILFASGPGATLSENKLTVPTETVILINTHVTNDLTR